MLNRAIVLSVTLLCGAAAVVRANRPEQAPPRVSFDQFPSQLGSWSGQALPPMENKVLGVLGVDDYVNRVYARPDHAVAGLYIGYYKSQRQGDSIHSPQNCLPGSGWEPLERSDLTIAAPVSTGVGDISVNRYLIQKGLDRQLVLYWYQSHGRVVASEYWSKFFLVRDAIRLNRTDAALVRVIVPIANSEDDGETRAQGQAIDFVKTMFPQLSKYLPA
ncbi:MAG TPA: EpsI family protein [Vicinamibacterales bacterium]|nr:EpsI family protein [Vicinamibacterales bacterium]